MKTPTPACIAVDVTTATVQQHDWMDQGWGDIDIDIDSDSMKSMDG